MLPCDGCEMNSTKPPPPTPGTPCFPDTPSSTASTLVESTLTPTEPQRQRRSLSHRRFTHLLRPLAPLLSIETGRPHPRFPATLLQFHLLSNKEVEDLAHFYHQDTPSQYSLQYPMPVVARWHAPAEEVDDEVQEQVVEIRRRLGYAVDHFAMESTALLAGKRRRFGRFMGLQGMRSAEGEGEMREAMERWVADEMAKREQRDQGLECWKNKGFW